MAQIFDMSLTSQGDAMIYSTIVWLRAVCQVELVFPGPVDVCNSPWGSVQWAV